MKRSRYQNGSVRLDPRTNTWEFRWRENGKRLSRKLGTLAQLPTLTKATRAAEGYRLAANAELDDKPAVTFEAAARMYMVERMPKRHTTRTGYTNILENHVIPKWGEAEIGTIKPLAVDRWFAVLPFAPKTKSHIKGVMRQVFEYTMLCELLDAQRNPMDFVRVERGTMRQTEPRVLTPEEFGRLLQFLPSVIHRNMVTVAVCLGLRRSELMGLKWSDFDWINNTVLVQRGVVANRTDAVKTKYSKKQLPLDSALTALLRNWRQMSEFNSDSDWVWASPWVAGAMPYYPNAIQFNYIRPAGKQAGLGDNIGWHTFRHTYRAWLDQTKAPMTVQKDLMRHANISTTMNVYGGAMPEPMREANSAVVRMVIQ
jgi:integrase